MPTDDDEYITELREVRRKRETQRSKSSKSAEFESDLLRDKITKNVAGPTESRPFDTEAFRQQVRDELTSELADTEPPFDYRSMDAAEDRPAPVQKRELTAGQQALVEAVVDVAVEVTTTLVREVVAPFVRDVALPAARAKIDEMSERRRARAAERLEAKARALEAKTVDLKVVDEVELVTTDLAAAEPSTPVSRSEYLRAQLELKLAEDYAARKRWLLAHADVEDEDLTPALEQSITFMLEGRAAELDEDQREAVAVFLRSSGNPPSPGRAIPIESDSDE